MYKVRRFLVEDMAALEGMPEQHILDVLPPNAVRDMEQAGGFTLMAHGRVVACGGVLTLWPGVAEAWICVSVHAKDHPSFVYRYAKAVIEVAIKVGKLHRLQAHVQTNFTTARRFMEHLGFELESGLTRFGPDQADYVLYRRLL